MIYFASYARLALCGCAGSGLSRLDAAIIYEALSYGDVPVAAYLSIHNMVASVIDRYGSEQQRRDRLPALTSMQVGGARRARGKRRPQ